MLKVLYKLFGDVSDAIGREGHVPRCAEVGVEQGTQTIHHGPQAHALNALALRPAEMRGQDHLCLRPQRKLDGRQRLADARVVEDLPAILRKRNVEVDADKDALAMQIEVAD